MKNGKDKEKIYNARIIFKSGAEVNLKMTDLEVRYDACNRLSGVTHKTIDRYVLHLCVESIDYIDYEVIDEE